MIKLINVHLQQHLYEVINAGSSGVKFVEADEDGISKISVKTSPNSTTFYSYDTSEIAEADFAALTKLFGLINKQFKYLRQ